MIDKIQFGSTVRCIHRDRNGNPIETVQGVFIGQDPDNGGCGLISPNEQPQARLSIPLDDLELVED